MSTNTTLRETFFLVFYTRLQVSCIQAEIDILQKNYWYQDSCITHWKRESNAFSPPRPTNGGTNVYSYPKGLTAHFFSFHLKWKNRLSIYITVFTELAPYIKHRLTHWDSLLSVLSVLEYDFARTKAWVIFHPAILKCLIHWLFVHSLFVWPAPFSSSRVFSSPQEDNVWQPLYGTGWAFAANWVFWGGKDDTHLE